MGHGKWLSATMGAVLVTALGTTAPALAVSGGDAYGWVVLGDGKARQVMVLDSRNASWNLAKDPGALKWKWKPSAKNGFPEAELDDCTACSGAIADARLRYGGPRQTGGKSVLAVNDGGFIGVASYPSGKRLWAVDTGGDGILPHAVELLPDGNVAAAATKGSWVRVYTASQSSTSKKYAEFKLPGGHGVLWDPANELLWALGDKDLVALKVSGTPAQPVLTETQRVPLPGKKGGHDMAPVFGDKGRLWVTTNDAVYQYVKSTGTFTTEYANAAKVNVRLVKSVGDQQGTGQVLRTRPKSGCGASWCTDTVEFFGGTASRTLPGTKIYKARWFRPDYQ